MKLVDYEAAREHIEKALAAGKRGDLYEAERILEEGLEANPGNPHLLAALSDVYYRTGRLEEALAMSEQVIETHPGLRNAQVVKGNALFSQKRFSEALDHIREADRVRNDRFVTSRIVSCLLRLNRLDEAEGAVVGFLEAHPDSIVFLRHLATIYHRSGREKEAEETYERILRLKKGDTRSYQNLIRLRMKSHPPEESIREVDRLLGLDSHRDNSGLRLVKADTLKKSGKLEEAVREYRIALETSPGDLYAMKQLGFCYSRLGRFTEAAAMLEEPFLDDPSNYALRSSIVRAYRETAEVEKLKELVEEALRRKPHVRSLYGILKKVERMISPDE